MSSSLEKGGNVNRRLSIIKRYKISYVISKTLLLYIQVNIIVNTKFLSSITHKPKSLMLKPEKNTINFTRQRINKYIIICLYINFFIMFMMAP
jgi:hypothetical protein